MCNIGSKLDKLKTSEQIMADGVYFSFVAVTSGKLAVKEKPVHV